MVAILTLCLIVLILGLNNNIWGLCCIQVSLCSHEAQEAVISHLWTKSPNLTADVILWLLHEADGNLSFWLLRDPEPEPPPIYINTCRIVWTYKPNCDSWQQGGAIINMHQCLYFKNLMGWNLNSSQNFRVGLNLEVTRFLIHFNVSETSFSYTN